MLYFDLLKIPVSLHPDQSLLRRQFYSLSREYHPDRFPNLSGEEQQAMLERSALLNRAYRTLQDEDETLRYVLMEKNMLDEEEKAQLPADFLMDMLDWNEELMEIELEPDADKMMRFREKVESFMAALKNEVLPEMGRFPETATQQDLQALKTYYHKKKYLLRIWERLRNIAAH